MKTTELPAEQLQSEEEKRVQEKVHIIKNMMQMASKLKQSEAFRKVRKDQILTRTEKKEKSQALQRVPKEECTTRMVV